MYRPTAKVTLDARLIPRDLKDITITKGAKNINFYNVEASGSGISSVKFIIQSLSENYVMDRRVYLRGSGVWRLTSSAGNPTIFPPGVPISELGVIGLKPYALQGSLSSFKINMNGTTLNQESYRLIDQVYRDYDTNVADYQNKSLSIMSNKQNPSAVFDLTFGTPRSPFAPIYTDSQQESWAVIPTYTVLSDNGAVAELLVEWTEPLTFLFNPTNADVYGLANIKDNLTIDFSVDIPLLSSALKYDNDNAPTALDAITFTAWGPLGTEKLSLDYILLDIPGVNLTGTEMQGAQYQFCNFATNTNAIGTFIPSVPRIINIGSTYTLSRWPKYVVMYAQRNNPSSFLDQDYLRINKILNLNIGNIKINMQSKNQLQYYQTLLGKGLNLSYTDFLNKGIAWVLDLTSDFEQIPWDLGANTPMQATISIQLELENKTNVTGDFTLYMLFMNDFMVTTASGNRSVEQEALIEPSTILSEAEVLESALLEKEEVIDKDFGNSLVSGSLMGNVRKIITRGREIYSSHKGSIDNIISTGAKLGMSAGELLLPLISGGLSYEQAVKVLQENNIPLPRSGSLSMGSLATPDMLRDGKRKKPMHLK
jgi:hypothetical protein